MKEINYDRLLAELNSCESKYDLVQVLLKNGIRTTTKPMQTKCKNDLYFQFADRSRIQIEEESIKLLTTNLASKYLENDTWSFHDISWDGRYRTKYVTVQKTPENLKRMMEYFLQDENNLI